MLGNVIPEGPGHIFEYINANSDKDVDEALPQESLFIRIRRHFKTATNSFSLERTYYGLPTNIPDQGLEFTYLLSDGLLTRATPVPKPQRPPIRRTILEIIAPYPTISAFILNRWFWKTGIKTKNDHKSLLEGMRDERFRLADVLNVDFEQLDHDVVDYMNQQDRGGAKDASNLEAEEDMKGWKTSMVGIEVPTGQKETKAAKKKKAKQRRTQAGGELPKDKGTSLTYHIPNFHHRSLVELITEVCSKADSSDFHWHPYEERWQPPWEDADVERVHGELYSSSAFLEANRLLQESPREPSCDLPRVIVALIFYSDATHLSQFGQAKLSPIYVFFGNQSKYERGIRERRAAHTLAFLPNVSSSFLSCHHKLTTCYEVTSWICRLLSGVHQAPAN